MIAKQSSFLKNLDSALNGCSFGKTLKLYLIGVALSVMGGLSTGCESGHSAYKAVTAVALVFVFLSYILASYSLRKPVNNIWGTLFTKNVHHRESIIKRLSRLFWLGAMFASLAFCGFAYYLKFPDVRRMVDSNVPFLRQIAGPLIAKWDATHTPQEMEVIPSETPAPTPSLITHILAPSTPAATPQQQLDNAPLQSKRDWPKTARLKTTVEFPAVLDGRVVGTVKAPAGTITRIILIKNNKLGLEFQGGGAMVPIGDTDLAEQFVADLHLGDSLVIENQSYMPQYWSLQH